MFYNSRKQNFRICIFFWQREADFSIKETLFSLSEIELIVSVLRNDSTEAEAECNLRKIRKDTPSPQKSRTLNSNFLHINSSDKYKNEQIKLFKRWLRYACLLL